MKTDQVTWYVIADATRARVVKLVQGSSRSLSAANHSIVPALEQEFVGRNLKSREVLADALGQRIPGHPATPADPRENAKLEFARELASILDKAISQHQVDRLILIAPPEMLGKIRGSLTEQVKRRVASERDKDLTQLSETELAERLAALDEHTADDLQ
jgi:protein required for attachment to host cells